MEAGEGWRRYAATPIARSTTSVQQTNLGLGLALSRGLAEAMSGTLMPEQTPGGGLNMVLSLPVAEPSTEARGSE